MIKNPRPAKYSGALSTRLKSQSRGDSLSDLFTEWFALPGGLSIDLTRRVEEEFEAAFFDFGEQRLAKLPALFKHYAIGMDTPDCWRQLVYSLAVAHVKGFQIERPKGRKLGQSRSDFELWANVRLEQIQSGHTTKRVCELIWQRNGKKGAHGALRRRFTAANKVYGAHYKNLPADILKRDLLTFRSRMKNRLTVKMEDRLGDRRGRRQLVIMRARKRKRVSEK